MSRTNIADILCIGAQRAMTTWLHQLLEQHPGAWAFPNFEPLTSTSKEAHYWDWNHHRGPTWYRVLARPENDDLQSLDFTPEYAFLDEDQIDECKRLNPEARVIYILRDPLARAMSAIRMRTLWASKNAPADRVTLRHDEEFLERCRNALLWDHGAYSANIRRWRRQYPEILLLNFEELRDDPVAGAKRVMAHCGLDWEGLDEPVRARLRERAARQVWATPAYAFEPDAVHFLHGALWPEREALAAETGMRFTEGDAILEALA